MAFRSSDRPRPRTLLGPGTDLSEDAKDLLSAQEARDRLLMAWVAETGLLPSRARIVERKLPDGVTHVTIEEKDAFETVAGFPAGELGEFDSDAIEQRDSDPAPTTRPGWAQPAEKP